MVFSQRKKTKQTPEKTIPYSLRERVATNFMNLEVPDDDSYLCKTVYNYKKITHALYYMVIIFLHHIQSICKTVL